MLDNHSAGWSSSGRRVRNRDRWSYQVAHNPRRPAHGEPRSVERATGSRKHREPFGHAGSWLYNPASVSACILYMTSFWRWPIRLSQCCVLTFDDVEHCLMWENTFLHLNWQGGGSFSRKRQSALFCFILPMFFALNYMKADVVYIGVYLLCVFFVQVRSASL